MKYSRLFLLALVVLFALGSVADAAVFNFLRLTGDVEIGSRADSYSKVTIDSATGNTVIEGTLDVTGDTAITGDAAVTGDLTVTGSITGTTVSTFADGTAGTPGIRWTSDTNSGFYRIGADNMGLSLGGTKYFDFLTTGLNITGILGVGDGAVGAPALFFTGDTNSGIYRIGADNIGIGVAGAKVLDVSATGLGVTGTATVSGLASLNAGLALDTSVFTIADTTGVLSSIPTTTTGTAWTLDASTLTSGTALLIKVDNDPLSGGYPFMIYGGAGADTNQFSVAEGGVVYSLGKITATGGLDVGTGYSGTGASITAAGAGSFDSTLAVDGLASFNAGIALDSTVFTIADTTGVISSIPTTTTSSATVFDYSTLTSGNGLVLKADDDILDGGKVLNILGGASADTTQFNVAEGGVVYSLGAITATGGLNTGTGFSGTGATITAAGAASLDSTLTVTGAASLNGGLALDTSVLTVADTTGAISWVPTATTTTAGLFDFSTLTSGVGLQLKADDDILNGGKVFDILGGAAADTTQFNVQEGGVVYSLGKITATGGLDTGTGYAGTGATISNAGVAQFDGAITTAADVTATGAALTPAATQDAIGIVGTALTSGDGIQIAAVDATLDGGKYINLLGGAGATAVFTVGEDGVTAITGTATSGDSLTVTNLTMTDGNALKIVVDSDASTTGNAIQVLSGTDHATPVFVVEAGDGALDLTGDITLENDEAISNDTDGYINTSGILNPVALMYDVVTNTDGSEDAAVATSGQLFIATKSDGTTTFTVPAPAAGTVGCVWTFLQTADQTMKITAVGGDDTDVFVTLNSQDSDYAAFDQASQKIGTMCKVIGVSATKHMIVNCTVGATLTVTDTD